jgi:hypothetical protein
MLSSQRRQVLSISRSLVSTKRNSFGSGALASG